LNGLLLGYALPATAGAHLLMLTRRTVQLEVASRRSASVLSAARRAIGRTLDAALWEALQPGRPLPSKVRSAEEWHVSDVWQGGGGRGWMAGSVVEDERGGSGDAAWRCGRQGAQLVLVRSCLFCMDDVRRDDLAASGGGPG
jgi:hypothetical protein